MVLFMIGLGLHDEKDITVRGLEAVRSCSKVYLESYTSILSTTPERLESFYGVPVISADRMMVESQSETILEEAKSSNIGFLVVGDPFGATTHIDFYSRAIELGIQVEIIHNASIMSAVGVAGLYLYRFGETVSVPFFTERWKPTSFYDKIDSNRSRGLHTLVLLDIKVKEQSEEDMIRGRMVFQPPRFMTVAQACAQIVEAEEITQKGTLSLDSEVIAAVRVGTNESKIAVNTIRNFLEIDLGPPLHSLIVPGDLSDFENQILNYYRS